MNALQIADKILKDAPAFSDWKKYATSFYWIFPKGVWSDYDKEYFPKCHILKSDHVVRYR